MKDIEGLLKRMQAACEGADFEDVLSCTVTLCAFAIAEGYPPQQHQDIVNGISRIMKNIIKNEVLTQQRERTMQ